MGGRSKIGRLDAAIKEAVDGLIRGGATVDEIHAYLASVDVAIARSTVGLYKQTMEESLRDFLEAKKYADIWAEKLGEQAGGDVQVLLGNMLQQLSYQTLQEVRSRGEAPAASEIELLSRTIRNLSAARKTDVDREVRIREQVAREERLRLEKAVEAAGAEIKGGGLSPEQALERVRAIYRGEG